MSDLADNLFFSSAERIWLCIRLNNAGKYCDIHTYIIGHYNLSVRIIDLVSYTIYVMCVNFIHKWRDLQLKVDSERQIWETFLGNFIFALRVFARNLLRGNRRRNTFRISFWCLAWDLNTGFFIRPRRYNKILRHYFENHGNVADFGSREAPSAPYVR